MFFKKKKQQLTREQSLESIPLRNESITAEEDDDGTICFLIPRKDTWWVNVLARILYIPNERKIGLDEIGTYVWNMCDGKTSVKKMIRRFSKDYKLNKKEAEISMVTYLKTLAKKGIIGIAVPEGKSKNKGKKKERSKSRR